MTAPSGRGFHRNGKPNEGRSPGVAESLQAAGVPGRIPHDMRRTAIRDRMQVERVAHAPTGVTR